MKLDGRVWFLKEQDDGVVFSVGVEEGLKAVVKAKAEVDLALVF